MMGPFKNQADNKPEIIQNPGGLPIEVWLLIFRYLKPEGLALLSQASRALHDNADDDELWRPRILQDFGQAELRALDEMNNPPSAKSYYGELREKVNRIQPLVDLARRVGYQAEVRQNLSAHLELYRFLLRQLTRHEMRDKAGNSAFIIAVREKMGVPLIKDLIGAGVDLRAVDYNGRTALTLAVINNDRESVKLLLEAGADRNRFDINRDKSQRTPLMYAAEKGHTEIMLMLLKAGANAALVTEFIKGEKHSAVYFANRTIARPENKDHGIALLYHALRGQPYESYRGQSLEHYKRIVADFGGPDPKQKLFDYMMRCVVAEPDRKKKLNILAEALEPRNALNEFFAQDKSYVDRIQKESDKITGATQAATINFIADVETRTGGRVRLSVPKPPTPPK